MEENPTALKSHMTCYNLNLNSFFYQSQKRKKRNDGAARNPPHWKNILIQNPGPTTAGPCRFPDTPSLTTHTVCKWKSRHCHHRILFCKIHGQYSCLCCLISCGGSALIDTVGSTKKKSWLRPWFPFPLRRCFMSNLHTHVVLGTIQILRKHWID